MLHMPQKSKLPIALLMIASLSWVTGCQSQTQTDAAPNSTQTTEANTPAQSNAPTESEETNKPEETKQESSSVKSIGDGSKISFKQWKGLRKGSGTLTLGKTKNELELGEFELKEDGSASISLQGTKYPKSVFLGNWVPKDDSSVTITCTKGPENVELKATGVLKFMDSENPFVLSLEGFVLSPEGKSTKTTEKFAVEFRMGG